ncbi:MAG: hypothetical protein IKQ83_05065 [Lachnospiraceae bacterium]|nr:hypothetical protein [Lachnospiraceae bacterium]
MIDENMMKYMPGTERDLDAICSLFKGDRIDMDFDAVKKITQTTIMQI